jgi:hypothetical protein
MSRYSYWNYTASAAEENDSESVHTTTSKRIFEATPGEQDAAANFYSGTKVKTPGPGTYNGNLIIRCHRSS